MGPRRPIGAGDRAGRLGKYVDYDEHAGLPDGVGDKCDQPRDLKIDCQPDHRWQPDQRQHRRAESADRTKPELSGVVDSAEERRGPGDRTQPGRRLGAHRSARWNPRICTAQGGQGRHHTTAACPLTGL